MNHFIPYSPTPTEPWLTEASVNQGESRDVTNYSAEYYDKDSLSKMLIIHSY